MWSVKLAAIAGVASKLVCNVQKLYATPDKNISVSIRATVRANPRVRRTNTGIRARNVALRRSIYDSVGEPQVAATSAMNRDWRVLPFGIL